MKNRKKTGLYIHVPFCVRKCPYCDFYSVASSKEKLYEQYADAVIRNIKRYVRENPEIFFETVYFGGGTPSLLPVYLYEKIMSEISLYTDFERSEITIELNPGTSDEDKLRKLRSIGINRLSVGIQSAADNELKYLGRIHDFTQAKNIINDAYSAGLENISADLMIGVREQTMESLMFSIDRLTELPLKHISAYMLKIEEGTEYFKNGMSELVPDEDLVADMYLALVEKLKEKGYFQYEISNFSRKGYESRHNLRYWHCESYIGIGPSAHSYFNNKRYEVLGNLSEFILSDCQKEIINDENPDDFFEIAMLQLRLTEGLDTKLYPKYSEKIIKRATKLEKAGLISVSDGVISMTPEGFLISNSVITELLADF